MMPGTGTAMALGTRTLAVDTILVSRKAQRRQAAVASALEYVAGTSASIVRGTVRATQRRVDGRYTTGWVVSVRVVRDGRAWGLGDHTDLTAPTITAVEVTA